MSMSKQGLSAETIDIDALRELLRQATLKLGGTEHNEIIHTAQNGVPAPAEGQYAHQEHGVAIDHNIPQADVLQASPDLWWPRTRHYFREPFSEFFGTLILILFGDGVVAQVVLSGGKNGSYQSITWGWA